jgi:hypothetical protein
MANLTKEGNCENNECGKWGTLYWFKRQWICYSCYCPEYKPTSSKPTTSTLGQAQIQSLGTVGLNRCWRKSYKGKAKNDERRNYTKDA